MGFYFRQDRYRVDKNWLPSIHGYAVLFDVKATRANGKTYLFSRGSFALELARRSDVKACIGHDGPTFATVRSRSLYLWEDETGLAFSASIPRGRKFIFLPDRIAEGQMGVSIEYKKIATVVGPESRAITAVDLFHLGLTTHPVFPTGAWLSNFSLMRNPPPRLKELREAWFAGQRPVTRIDPKYRSRSAYPFLVWEGYL